MAHECLTNLLTTSISRDTSITKREVWFITFVSLVSLVAFVAVVADVADVLGRRWVSLELCSNIWRNFYLPFVCRIR